MTILECYLAVSLCMGVSKPPPRMVILPKPAVPCPVLKGRCVDAACTQRYDGTCSGVFRHGTVYVTYKTQAAMAHEFIHHLINDRKHTNPKWEMCQAVCD
jgi:hypothetical protein